MELERGLPGLCSETQAVSSQDADEVMSMKIEEVSSLQEEEVPMLRTWQAIKAEHEVSFSPLRRRKY
jgi:hypothetical protein